VENASMLDPHDLVFMVAGMLYSSGHHPIRLDERTLYRAVPAAGDLLRAFGISPVNPQRRRLQR
jgi:hypothetical protein